jgi:alpha-glucosidase
VDVIWLVVKDDQFRDNPRNPSYHAGQIPYHEFIETYNADQPDVHHVIAEMRKVLDGYPERMMVGEIYLPLERLVTYYGDGGTGAHMPFNFQLVTLPWSAAAIAHAVNDYEGKLPEYGWPNWVLGNHDQPRIASRVGERQARVAAMLLLTLRGTPTMYYGDEIGMRNVSVPPDRVQDPLEKNVPGMGLGRDPQRSPMQWDAGPNAGFGPAEPWLPLADDCDRVNVEAERKDPRSVLSFYRRLIELRRAEPALAFGSYLCIPVPSGAFAYVRAEGTRRFFVALNFTDKPIAVRCVDFAPRGRIAASTHRDRADELVNDDLVLRGDEGVLIELS